MSPERALLMLLGARAPTRLRIRRLATALIERGAGLADLPSALRGEIEAPARAWIGRELACVEALGLWACGLDDPRFPLALAAIPDPPIAIWVRGRLPAADCAGVAVVGSRRGTRTGCDLAFAAARALVAAGLPVVSGLAIGIDAAAHRGCLDGDGISIGVLGAGHAALYPRVHAGLAEALIHKGAVISEYPPTWPPAKHQFPERNRLISGLSRAVLVIEAGEKSGSLITARLALEQGRDVLAVPGLPGGRSRGCHRLIQAGAALVDSVEDLFAALGLGEPTHALRPVLDRWLAALLACVDGEPASLETIAARAELPVERAREGLVHLELDGFVGLADGRYSRRP